MRSRDFYFASGLGAATIALSAGCGTDLGSCDPQTSTALVYDGQGIPFYAGQFVVAKSCARGFCHSAGARRGARIGAPADLDFDVTTIVGPDDTNQETAWMRDGLAVIDDWDERMLGSVESDWMPPGDAGSEFAVNDACTEDPDLIDRLPAGDPSVCAPYGLQTVRFDVSRSDAQTVMKNWLACGAPVVERTEAPASGTTLLGDVVPARSAVDPTFASIWDIVLSDDVCTDCHQPGLPPTQAAFYEQSGELDFSGRQVAYRGLLGLDGMGAESNAQEVVPQGCRGSIDLLVEPGNPDDSILIQKLEAGEDESPPCGEAMPIIGSPLPQSTIDVIRDWITAGAANDG